MLCGAFSASWRGYTVLLLRVGIGSPHAPEMMHRSCSLFRPLSTLEPLRLCSPSNLFLQATGNDQQRKLTHDPEGSTYEHKGCYLDTKEDRVLWHRLTDHALTPTVRRSQPPQNSE